LRLTTTLTTHVKDDWNRSSRALRRERCSSAAVSKNHRYLAAHQLIGYGPKSVVLAPGGSVFKRDVSTLYISDFIQALAECVKQMREDFGCPLLRNPMTGIAGGCACAREAEVTPPARTARTSRRLIGTSRASGPALAVSRARDCDQRES
jgi:hypothetical protein